MDIKVKNLFGIVIFPLALLLVAQTASPAEKKPGKMLVFEVPTSGTIMDVQYHPEFDEWWVKCREGTNIVIYSYEKLTRKWGRVVFTPKKPDEKVKQTEGGKRPEAGATSGQTAAGMPQAETKQDSGQQTGPKKGPGAEHKQGDKKKWWDPLNIIKGGEGLIYPPSSSKHK
ncbi:MAG: hypothetical protein WBG50_01670 [Desulfomonilaceae bacterium]